MKALAPPPPGRAPSVEEPCGASSTTGTQAAIWILCGIHMSAEPNLFQSPHLTMKPPFQRDVTRITSNRPRVCACVLSAPPLLFRLLEVPYGLSLVSHGRVGSVFSCCLKMNEDKVPQSIGYKSESRSREAPHTSAGRCGPGYDRYVRYLLVKQRSRS